MRGACATLEIATSPGRRDLDAPWLSSGVPAHPPGTEKLDASSLSSREPVNDRHRHDER